MLLAIVASEVSDNFFQTIFFHVTAYGPQLKTQGFWQEEEQEEEEEEEQIQSNTFSAVTFLFFNKI